MAKANHYFLMILSVIFLSLSSFSYAKDKVTFGIGWKAEAEYGGFYQALATGIYEHFGFDVTIKALGPRSNMTQLLVAGQIDFRMGGNGYITLNYVKEDLPFVSVAAMFQKDPIVLIAHGDRQISDIEDLTHRKAFIASAARMTWWKFLVEKYGFRDEMLRPYNFTMAPFMSDLESFQQGYLTSEPYSLKKAGVPVKLFLLSDYGYNSYATMIDTSKKLVEENPDLVQRFVDASILGYYSYLYGDPTLGNALIKQENPGMTDDKIAYSRHALKRYGVVNSGITLERGIGMMTDEQWKGFFNDSVAIGLYPKSMAFQKAYTDKFIGDKARLVKLATELDIKMQD